MEPPTQQATTDPTGEVAPRVVILLPIAMLLHVAEEWVGGFPDWVALVFGNPIGRDQFLLINTLGLVLFTVGAIAASWSRSAAWFGVSIAALFVLNGVLHLVLSLAYQTYSPGTVTGLVAFIPLGSFVLWKSYSRLSKEVFAGSILFGVGIHAVATLTAISTAV